MSKIKLILPAISSLVIFLVSALAITAQTIKLEGLIKARNGETILLQLTDSRQITVLLTETTEVKQKEGVLQVRRKEMAMAALIPGLPIQVEGVNNSENQLVAKAVTFKGNDLEQAEAIQAGMHETQEQTQKNQQELEKQNAELKAQNAQLQAHEVELASQKAAIDAAVARFGQLDDYYIRDQVVVYFANGKVDLDPKYNDQLLQLAENASKINGYMIEIKGYASTVGSVALNQSLSEDRADNVANFLTQHAHVPLTRMLAPGAMGESHQVGDEKTADGQAENRRVVVRVLQNKAIAGV